jgi:asparagine synthase (glutamine-hydrolysing)
MCGIAGFMATGNDSPSASALQAMASHLAHRGPDGRGHYRVANVGMVHTRLAIIDLETGDQPLYEAGGAALIANGEIYNYVELKKNLPDTEFLTRSDCELPLHLYRRHGLDFTRYLRGMYAIALHDPSAHHLVLARDPFGIKPLYYAEVENGLAFASEPQALIASGLVKTRIDERARNELLQLQFTTGRNTIFAGIHRILPGETVVVAGGRIVERRRNEALPEGGPQAWNEAEALLRIDGVLEDSVRVHQRSDVPFGVFLSGGIDSSALLALMARRAKSRVLAFTAGFPGTAAHDERAHARAVAAAAKAEHVEVEFTERDFWELLPEIAASLDDPTADYAVLPLYKLARVASETVKVVLSGEGGDELFGGYGRYRSVIRPWWAGGRAMRSRGVFDGLDVLRQPQTGWRDGIEAAEIGALRPERTKLQVAQAVDCADWLPNDLLIKLDRCLMAHGVEGRTPFLDLAVADIAYRLPDRLKMNKGLGKLILRRWLARELPEAEPFSSKRGFTVPVAEWMRRRGNALGELLAAQPGIAEIASKGAVRRLFERKGKREGFACWNLLFFALWHRRHVLGLKPEGDVFDCLTASRDG